MALPGMTGVDHIGFTVPDLEQAHAFLVDVLGCEYLYSLGPFVHEDSDWMAEHLNCHPRAVMRRNSFFRCGGQAIFEVFHYEAPDQNPVPPQRKNELRRMIARGWQFRCSAIQSVSSWAKGPRE